MKPIKELEKNLLDKVAKRIAEYGFDSNIRGQSFYKGMPFGRFAFHLAFIRHHTDFDVTADVAIRFDALEDLINADNELLSKAEKRNTFSIGAELGNISEGKQKRWTVASPADVESVSRSIIDSFVNYGIPYLEKYSNLETALDTLSRDDQESWLHSPFHDVRAKEALGLAFLLDQRERFLKLADVKTEFLTTRKDFGLQSFLKFRDALEHRLISQCEVESGNLQ